MLAMTHMLPNLKKVCFLSSESLKITDSLANLQKKKNINVVFFMNQCSIPGNLLVTNLYVNLKSNILSNCILNLSLQNRITLYFEISFMYLKQFLKYLLLLR